MAKTTVVLINDDLEGGEADESLSFAFEGVGYEIDLNKKNADKLRKALSPYIDAARKTGRSDSHGGTPRSRRHRGGLDAAAVRAWAASNGIEINSRGRIPSAAVDQYRAAVN